MGREIRLTVTAGQLLRSFSLAQKGKRKHWCSSIDFSPDAKSLIGGSGSNTHGEVPGQLYLWSISPGETLRQFNGPTHSIWRVRFDPSGKQVIAATGNYQGKGRDIGNDVWVWDAATAVVRRVLRGHTVRVFDIAITSDGNRLASVGGNWVPRRKTKPSEIPGEMKIWDLQTGLELLSIDNPRGGLLATAFDDQSNRVAFGGVEGELKVLRRDQISND